MFEPLEAYKRNWKRGILCRTTLTASFSSSPTFATREKN
jgi:hypothetical protein